ncbi:uncharacterized protein KZ484_021867 isoform 2-T2 [Pholidichthys leucotaenia]
MVAADLPRTDQIVNVLADEATMSADHPHQKQHISKNGLYADEQLRKSRLVPGELEPRRIKEELEEPELPQIKKELEDGEHQQVEREFQQIREKPGPPPAKDKHLERQEANHLLRRQEANNGLMMVPTHSHGWSHGETKCLLAMWSDQSVQAKLDKSYHNRAIYEEMAKVMGENGYKRSWLQCQRKIKQLKLAYRKAKANKRKGRRRVTCSFFEEIDAVLSDRPALGPGQSHFEDMDSMESSNSDEDSWTGAALDYQPDNDDHGEPSLTAPAASDAPTIAADNGERDASTSTSAASEADGLRKLCSAANTADVSDAFLLRASDSEPVNGSNSAASEGRETPSEGQTRKRGRKRTRGREEDLMAFLRESDERARAVEERMLQHMEQTTSSLLGLMERMVSAIEGLSSHRRGQS